MKQNLSEEMTLTGRIGWLERKLRIQSSYKQVEALLISVGG
ncbi:MULTISPECIES: hypothetical protein [Brevibacillus]|nr:hypothetical protein [Brevibacillus borstelensis]